MTDTYCGNCLSPVHSTTLCSDCSADLVRYIEQADWVVDQLRNAQTRQQRFSKSVGARSTSETPVMFNDRASSILADYCAVLARWQERLADHFGMPVRYPNPIAAATWMWTTIYARSINTFIDAGHMLKDLESAHRAALGIINKPPTRWFAGRCSATLPDGSECPRDLYANAESGILTCTLCGTHHDIGDRRRTLLEAARNVLATATEAARAIVVWSEYTRGENRLVKRIWNWANRGRIEQHGSIRQDGQDRPLYLVGDILDLLADELSATTQESA